MDIVDALMKDSPKYRSGTHSKEFLKLQSARKNKYREIIEQVKVWVHEHAFSVGINFVCVCVCDAGKID